MNDKSNSGLMHELSTFPIYTNQTRGGKRLIEIRKIRGIVLYHETSI